MKLYFVVRFLDYQSGWTDKTDKADISVRLIFKTDTEKVCSRDHPAPRNHGDGQHHQCFYLFGKNI